MRRLHLIWERGLIAALAIASTTARCIESTPLATPQAPTVKIQGAPGTTRAAYWVVAKNAEGYLTSPSAPMVVNTVPGTLSKDHSVAIAVEPVTGAVEYAVLKTEDMQLVEGVAVSPATNGQHRFYYWVQWCNNWRESPLAGPFEAACADASGKGTTIEWEPLPNAMFYNVFRTKTPDPPMGRGFYAIALHVAAHQRFAWLAKTGPTRVVDKGWAGQCVCGRPRTPVAEPPMGSGLWMVGRTGGDAPVIDAGQPLTRMDISTVNATDRMALTGPRENKADVSERLGGQYVINPVNDLPHLRVPSFGAGHMETLAVINRVESGGHSEYHAKPHGGAGWKSWIAAMSARVESHTSSQHGALTAHLQSYGGGDAIPFDSAVHFYGCNNDGGDEGAYPSRNTSARHLSTWDATLTDDCSRGSSYLPVGKIDYRAGGAERVVVNLSQAHTNGRIVRVDNVTVRGRDTSWTPDMKHRWISFDVDNVRDMRCWYWITDVAGPKELTILAKTGWSSACNLGYSRFIYDPAVQDGPTPVLPNSAALRKLPEDRYGPAASGAYRVCPGVQLDDPWKDGAALHVEPLLRDWHKGDRIRIVAGPQGYIALARFMLHGEYLPQDQVGGISIRNTCNRIANFPAIQIAGPGSQGFREGIRVSLADDGSGDGIVISGADHYDPKGFPAGTTDVLRASIVVPTKIPGVCGPHPWRYPHLRWILSEDGDQDAMQIAMRGSGSVAASFDRHGRATLMHAVATRSLKAEGKTTLQDVSVRGAIQGSDQTRGQSTFSADGTTSAFEIVFGKALKQTPVVTFSDNQFERSRLAQVTRRGFRVEFEEPLPQGDENVTVWWMAQE